MKIIKTTLFFGVLFFASCSSNDEVTVVIDSNNPSADTLYIHDVITEQELAKFPLNNPENVYKFVLSETTLADVSVKSLKESPLVICSPGTEKIITIDTTGLNTKNSIADSLINYIWRSGNQMFRDYNKLIFVDDNPDAVITLFDSLIDARENLLKKNKTALSDDEFGLLAYQNQARAYSFLMFYGRMMKAYPPTHRFFNFIDKIDNDNPYTKSLPNNLLYKYEIRYLRENDSITSIISFLEYIEQETRPQDLRNFLKAYYLREVMENPSYWRKHQQIFTTNTVKEAIAREQNNSYAYLIQDASGSFFSSRKGVKGYDFVATKPDSSAVRLADFRGKLVLIDAWATWCGPCVDQRPNMLALAKKYAENPDLAVLMISVDKDTDKWKKYIARTNPGNYGNELSIPGGTSKAFGDNYLIKTIPKYILIDKNGVIVDANLPEPSLALEKIIQAELAKM